MSHPSQFSTADSIIFKVPAGANVTTEWHHENGLNPSDSADPVDPSHKGPISVYMAKVDSALTTTVTDLSCT